MQNPGTDRPATPNNAYCPSVPISVYRELSAELQAAQAMLEVLNNQNQQLLHQNQQLHQEINKVIQSTQNLQQIAAGIPPIGLGMPALNPSHLPMISPKISGLPEAMPTGRSMNRGLPSIPSLLRPKEAIAPSDLVMEEEGHHRRPSNSRTSDVNGWVLLLAILLIIVTAFGTSFLIIRPLFSGNNGSGQNSR